MSLYDQVLDEAGYEKVRPGGGVDSETASTQTWKNKRRWQATDEYQRERRAGQEANERREAKKAAKAKKMGVQRKPKYRSLDLPVNTQREIEQARQASKKEEQTLFDRIGLSEAWTMKRLASQGHIRKSADGSYEGVTSRGKAAIKSRSSRAMGRTAGMGASAARQQRLKGGKHAVEPDPRLSTVERGTKGKSAEGERSRVVQHLKRQGRDAPEGSGYAGEWNKPFKPEENPRRQGTQRGGISIKGYPEREREYQAAKKESPRPGYTRGEHAKQQDLASRNKDLPPGEGYLTWQQGSTAMSRKRLKHSLRRKKREREKEREVQAADVNLFGRVFQEGNDALRGAIKSLMQKHRVGDASVRSGGTRGSKIDAQGIAQQRRRRKLRPSKGAKRGVMTVQAIGGDDPQGDLDDFTSALKKHHPNVRAHRGDKEYDTLHIHTR